MKTDDFDHYLEHLAAALGHLDRVGPMKEYCTGLMLPVPRKSVEPLAALAQTKRSGTGFADRKRNTASIGYDYDLSKRTDLYAVYMRDRITGFDSGNSFAAGIRHRF